MNRSKLPPRLNAIASLVRPGAHIADVGTDHALLPIFLLEAGTALTAVATDINRAPLERAKRNAEEYGIDSIRFSLSDGLADVSRSECDTVIVAGLGGETIIGILERAPWIRENVHILLQPMTRAELLRRWLCENGYGILNETLVEDTGRIYPILSAQCGEPTAYTPGEYYAGKVEFLYADPLYASAVDEQLRRITISVRGLEQAGERRQSERKEMRELLMDLERIRKEI